MIVRRTTGNILISKYASFYPYRLIYCGIDFDNASNNSENIELHLFSFKKDKDGYSIKVTVLMWHAGRDSFAFLPLGQKYM